MRAYYPIPTETTPAEEHLEWLRGEGLTFVTLVQTDDLGCEPEHVDGILGFVFQFMLDMIC